MFNVNRKSNHMRTVNFSVDVNDSIVSKRIRTKAFKSADSMECRTSLKYFDSVHELQCITYPDRKTQRQMEFARISGSYDHSKVISSKTNNRKNSTEFWLRFYYDYYLKPDHVTLLLCIYKRNSTAEQPYTVVAQSQNVWVIFMANTIENRDEVWSGVRRGHRTFRVWNRLEHWSFYLTVIIRIKNVTTTWNELDDDII